MNESESMDKVFSALANRSRREIIAMLAAGGDRPVQEIADRFDMARPSVSEHLKVLRDAGLVAERRAGRQRLYSLSPGPLRDLRVWVDAYENFWASRMAAFRSALDEEP